MHFSCQFIDKRKNIFFLTLCCKSFTSKPELLESFLFCGDDVSDDIVPFILTLDGDGTDILVLESISSDDDPRDDIFFPQDYNEIW